METNTNTTVTSAQRVRANQLVKELRASQMHKQAMILDQACYWESFPQSYSAEQVRLARLLLTTDYAFSAQWVVIANAILTIIETK